MESTSTGNLDKLYTRKSLNDVCDEHPVQHSLQSRVIPSEIGIITECRTFVPSHRSIWNITSDSPVRLERQSGYEAIESRWRFDHGAIQYADHANLDVPYMCQALKDARQPSDDFTIYDASVIPAGNSTNATPVSYSSMDGLESQDCAIFRNDYGSVQQESARTFNETTALVDDNDNFTNKPFECQKCPAKFRYRHKLMKHKMIHDPTLRKAESCHECKATFRSVASMRAHVRVHMPRYDYHWRVSHSHVKYPFRCSTCGAMFETRRGLTSHEFVHKTDPKDMYDLVCSICGAQFCSKSNLNNHIVLIHQEFQPHVCPECGSKFSYRQELSAHMAKCPRYLKRELEVFEVEDHETTLLKEIQAHKFLKYICEKK